MIFTLIVTLSALVICVLNGAPEFATIAAFASLVPCALLETYIDKIEKYWTKETKDAMIEKMMDEHYYIKNDNGDYVFLYKNQETNECATRMINKDKVEFKEGKYACVKEIWNIQKTPKILKIFRMGPDECSLEKAIVTLPKTA